jgi:hypothetical protein
MNGDLRVKAHNLNPAGEVSLELQWQRLESHQAHPGGVKRQMDGGREGRREGGRREGGREA